MIPIRMLLPGWKIIHFGLSSCACLLLDKGVFTLICLPFEGRLGRGASISLAVVIARLISGHCNFYYNQRFVFRNIFRLRAYFQYWALVLINICLSIMLTSLISWRLDVHGFDITITNVCADVILFFLSYLVQKTIIFKR